MILAASEIRQMLDSIETQQQQFAALGNDHLFPDASIPITFTKVCNLKDRSMSDTRVIF